MVEQEESFEDFIHPFVHEVIEKNEGLEKLYGKHSCWDWDADSATLTLSDTANSTLRIEVTVVGTTEGTVGNGVGRTETSKLVQNLIWVGSVNSARQAATNNSPQNSSTWMNT
jgi:hypothetical protein